MRSMGTMVAVILGGLLLAGGIGENAAAMRARILDGLNGLGIASDPARNTAQSSGERDIATPDSPVRILVIPTDEERAIAEETYTSMAKR